MIVLQKVPFTSSSRPLDPTQPMMKKNYTTSLRRSWHHLWWLMGQLRQRRQKSRHSAHLCSGSIGRIQHFSVTIVLSSAKWLVLYTGIVVFEGESHRSSDTWGLHLQIWHLPPCGKDLRFSSRYEGAPWRHGQECCRLWTCWYGYLFFFLTIIAGLCLKLE